MSRRRGEFEHRTSIFEGAFRAWSHLGGLEVDGLESKTCNDLDPLSSPIRRDPRLGKKDSQLRSGDIDKDGTHNSDGSRRRDYPYEPLPRSGLAHPYVQAILSPWLGPDADNEAIQLGLTTLRTWWQHRRKGESGSAVAALGTEKMKGVVEGYTRHFFTLAHCLVMNDGEQPPRTLHTKMKEIEKIRNKRMKKKAQEQDDGVGNQDHTALTAGINADLTDSNLSPLERLHAAQRRQLAENGGISNMPGGISNLPGPSNINVLPIIDMKGKCIPGSLDLNGVVDAVNHQANQLAHRGNSLVGSFQNSASNHYGDPTTTPVVFMNPKDGKQIVMSVDGITCAHCVKIVETVLKGCNGNKSPISGLLDAAADRTLCCILIKIDKSINAKRIAYESARNLAMVGYTAKAKEMSVLSRVDKKPMHLVALHNAFDFVGNATPQEIFNWQAPCSCPDNGIMREDCARHRQIGLKLFEAFDLRQKLIIEYMEGSIGSNQDNTRQPQQLQQQDFSNQIQFQQSSGQVLRDQALHTTLASSINNGMFNFLSMGNGADGLGNGAMGPPGPASALSSVIEPLGTGNMQPLNYHMEDKMGMIAMRSDMTAAAMRGDLMGVPRFERRASRNPSMISFGGLAGLNGLHGMSMTSEATYGRAMSGLSALSIDWENLEDFDVEVDHSRHVNNGSSGDVLPSGFAINGNEEGAHVSFKVN